MDTIVVFKLKCCTARLCGSRGRVGYPGVGTTLEVRVSQGLGYPKGRVYPSKRKRVEIPYPQQEHAAIEQEWTRDHRYLTVWTGRKGPGRDLEPESYSPLNSLTNTCKNITFPQLRRRMVIILLNLLISKRANTLILKLKYRENITINITHVNL